MRIPVVMLYFLVGVALHSQLLARPSLWEGATQQLQPLVGEAGRPKFISQFPDVLDSSNVQMAAASFAPEDAVSYHRPEKRPKISQKFDLGSSVSSHLAQMNMARSYGMGSFQKVHDLGNVPVPAGTSASHTSLLPPPYHMAETSETAGLPLPESDDLLPGYNLDNFHEELPAGEQPLPSADVTLHGPLPSPDSLPGSLPSSDVSLPGNDENIPGYLSALPLLPPQFALPEYFQNLHGGLPHFPPPPSDVSPPGYLEYFQGELPTSVSASDQLLHSMPFFPNCWQAEPSGLDYHPKNLQSHHSNVQEKQPFFESQNELSQYLLQDDSKSR
ncbi:hypothetical protein PTTG_26457 [Puccinia triticina 1-1 BBBD Race 1]|uniref:Uncharacterized protein n=1 Tax=Puccinia triticina (isolate 1-1 / race 1 (BBBD)) TaxID=630390 RepID=A0A180GTE5_PUCT1|nr:hypothetical protein PTTG_26457 [Puccinia triticina 1-1 BBBD Race 1]